MLIAYDVMASCRRRLSYETSYFTSILLQTTSLSRRLAETAVVLLCALITQQKCHTLHFICFQNNLNDKYRRQRLLNTRTGFLVIPLFYTINAFIVKLGTASVRQLLKKTSVPTNYIYSTPTFTAGALGN